MTQEEFASIHGLHVNTLRRYESGERSPEPEFLNGLTERFPTLNPVWLLTGHGPKVRPEILADATDDERNRYFSAVSPEEKASFDRIVDGVSRLGTMLEARQDAKGYSADNFALIPLYDVRAAAGHGALAEDRDAAEHWAFSRAWLSREVRVAAERLKLVTVAGDSMEPDLHDGDVVMIDVGDVESLREGVYVFSLGGHVYVKRLVLHNEHLIVISRNRDLFPPMAISTMRENSTFHLIGRVVGQPTFRRF